MVHGGDAQAVQLNRQLAEILRFKVTCQLTQPGHHIHSICSTRSRYTLSSLLLQYLCAFHGHENFRFLKAYLGRLRDISPPVFRHALC
jgi:hypothetical protein